MGSFDSVFCDCVRPGCDGKVEFQTKDGNCELKRWKGDCVPPFIAQALEGQVGNCEKCGTEHVFRMVDTLPTRIECRAVANVDRDEDGKDADGYDE